jgi:hypothetical protein
MQWLGPLLLDVTKHRSLSYASSGPQKQKHSQIELRLVRCKTRHIAVFAPGSLEPSVVVTHARTSQPSNARSRVNKEVLVGRDSLPVKSTDYSVSRCAGVHVALPFVAASHGGYVPKTQATYRATTSGSMTCNAIRHYNFHTLGCRLDRSDNIVCNKGRTLCHSQPPSTVAAMAEHGSGKMASSH